MIGFPSRLKGWLPRPGLIGQVAVALILVGLAPIAVVTYRLADLNQRAMEDQTLQTHTTVARTTATRLEALLNGWRIAAESIATNPALDGSGSLLTGLLASQPDLLTAALVNRNGELVARAQVKGLGDEAEEILAGSASATWTVTESVPAWVRIDLPLYQERGFLRLAYRLDPIAEVLDVPEFAASADLVLASSDGRRVLAGTTDTLAGFPQSLVNEAATGQMIGAKRDLTVGDETYLGAYAAVESSSWFILSLQPSYLAERISIRLRRQTLFAVALAILLTGAITMVAYSTLVRPIRGLLQAQRRLAGLGPTGYGNEIAQLQETFNLLQRRLRDREELGEVMLGRYQILEILGEGGMGTVFRAWDPQLQRPVALKTVRLGAGPETRTQAELVASLSEEAVAIARISHECIVAIYDFIRGEDVAFIAMEYVDGMTLTELIKLRGVLTTEDTVHIGNAIARALAAAHSQGIVHCDVKPSNILITREGGIKLADFGVAQFLSAALEGEEKVVGTPGFMPPEALLGEGYTLAADLFALGAVLYTCLLGDLPFPGGSAQVIIANTLAGIDRDLQRLPSHHPQEMEELIFELLSEQPQDRPASATEVAERLSEMGFDLSKAWKPSLEPAAESPPLVLRLSRLSTLQRPELRQVADA
jgi:serine/threonine-protein kinase